MTFQDRYSREDFAKATSRLRDIVAGTPSLVPFEGEPWEVSMVCDFDGSAPQGSARFRSGDAYVALSVKLQDDGFEPYAVVDVMRVVTPKNWRTAHSILSVVSIYPAQFPAIPKIVGHLLTAALPAIPDEWLAELPAQKLRCHECKHTFSEPTRSDGSALDDCDAIECPSCKWSTTRGFYIKLDAGVHEK